MDAPRSHGQILEAFSISAGLDYPGIPVRTFSLPRYQTCQLCPVTDRRSLGRIQLLSRCGKNYPALESSHAIAFAVRVAKELGPEKSMIVCLHGSWGQDVVQVKDRLEADATKEGRSSCPRH